MDTKVTEAEPTEEEKLQTDKVYEFFLKLAGEDREVDWKELQDILNYSMQTELQGKNKGESKKTFSSVNAAPNPNNNQPSLINQLFTLICGTICKDTPLAEYIPQPVKVEGVSAGFSELRMEGFSKDICRSMVAMLDCDRSGKLGYEEFKELWISLRNWKNVWGMYDVDSSGSFSGFELKDALNSAGYKLNNHILNALMHRYGSRSGEISFDDFLMCAIKLKTMMEKFKKKDVNETNVATFSIEEFLEVTLYT